MASPLSMALRSAATKRPLRTFVICRGGATAEEEHGKRGRREGGGRAAHDDAVQIVVNGVRQSVGEALAH